MAIQSPEQIATIESLPVLASPKDPNGFDLEYQRRLRERIIQEHVTAILGPIMIVKTIPDIPDELRMLILGPQLPRPSYTPGAVKTHIAPNLVTCNEQTGAEIYAMRRQQSKEDS